MFYKEEKFDVIVCKQIASIETFEDDPEGIFVVINFTDLSTCCLRHKPECCKEVIMVDVVGFDPKDLEGARVCEFRHVTLNHMKGKYMEGGLDIESNFYHLETDKGFITFVFHGEGNGNYSLEAEFVYVSP